MCLLRLRQRDRTMAVVSIFIASLLLIIEFTRGHRSPGHQERIPVHTEAVVRNTDRIPLRVEPTRSSGSNIDVADLAINWKFYHNRTVATKGRLRCDNEDFCAFARRPELRMSVVVDISTLPAPTRRHLILDCKDGCDVIVVGNVDYDDIFALSVSDVPAEQSSATSTL
jgi:hypothetical protein